MYPVSSAFLEALRSPSMRIASKVVASDGTVLLVESGSVTMDSTRNITRTCELDLLPTATLSLDQVFDLVMQPDVELQVYRGLYVNGTPEYVSLGVFSTDTASMPQGVQGRIRWSGSDRSKKITRARFTDPYQITSGTALATAVQTLLQSRFADVQVDFSAVVDTVTANLVFEAGASSDPWQSARDLMSDYGYDLNFNGDGLARAVVIPDPAEDVADFDFGSGDTNLIVGGDISGTLENVYNGVIATGEGTGITTPTRGEAWDMDPTSPTYYQGGFGASPLFFTSPLLTTTDIAQTAATALLAKLKGRLKKMSWPAVVNPALEPLDVVNVNFGTTTSKVVLDTITIPLNASEAMQASAREVSIT